MKKKLRTTFIKIRLTEAERKLYKVQAKRAGLSLSAWGRKHLEGIFPPPLRWKKVVRP